MTPDYRPDASDDDLIYQLRAGSSVAFETIYNRYWRHLLAITYHHTGDKTAAEEAVQDVFMSLWRRRDDVVIGSLHNYLTTAVKFTLFRQLLKEKRRRQLLEKNYPAVTWSDPDAAINARLLEEYLQTAMKKLPEKCRLVFIYSRQEELTMAQIAEKMNISVKTAEAHLTKALKRLRESLKRVYFMAITADLFCRIFF